MKQMGYCGQSWCTHLCQRFYVLCSQVEVVLQRQQVYGRSEDTNDHLLRPRVNPKWERIHVQMRMKHFLDWNCVMAQMRKIFTAVERWWTQAETEKGKQNIDQGVANWLLLSVWWTLQPPWVYRSHFTHFQEWYKLCIHFSVQSKLHWN